MSDCHCLNKKFSLANSTFLTQVMSDKLGYITLKRFHKVKLLISQGIEWNHTTFTQQIPLDFQMTVQCYKSDHYLVSKLHWVFRIYEENIFCKNLLWSHMHWQQKKIVPQTSVQTLDGKLFYITIIREKQITALFSGRVFFVLLGDVIEMISNR